MATIREYVDGKLARVGLEIEDIELTVLMDQQSVDDSTQCNDATSLAIAKRIIVDAIPELLLLPDVQEGGMSVKRNPASIRAYYALLCNELGIENKLDPPAPTPTVSDASNRW